MVKITTEVLKAINQEQNSTPINFQTDLDSLSKKEIKCIKSCFHFTSANR